MSNKSLLFRDGVFCGLGLAIGVVQEEIERNASIEGRELLRSLKDAIAAAGALWSRENREVDLNWPTSLSEEVTPT